MEFYPQPNNQGQQHRAAMTSLDDLRVDNEHESNGVNVGDFLAQLETKRQQNAQLVPTDDDEVKNMLRMLDEPITLFGEDKGDRRDRLVKIVVERQIDVQSLLGDQDEEMEDESDEEEEFYTHISEELLAARKFITTDSLERAQVRLANLTERSKVTSTKQLLQRRANNDRYKTYELSGSQMVSTRPTSTVAINSLDTTQILTGSWSGEIKLVNKENLEITKEFSPQDGKIGGLDWSPTDPSLFIASSDTLSLYNTSSDRTVSTYTGHTSRIVRSRFHPSGKYIASASFDHTWRLWDVETTQELQLQEGHSKEVYTLQFHPDGSLIASAGLDAIGHIWDLRLGKSIFVLNGHVKPIYGLDWRDNGVHLATGAADGLIKIWDMRMTQEVESIPAHTKIVSECKFSGDHLVSSSYDGTVKVYSADNWITLNTLQGHADKVMGVDVCEEYIVSVGWDRSLKLWTTDQLAIEK